MNEELDSRLTRIEKMVSENNNMLSSLRRSQKNAVYMRIVYWVLIIGVTIVSIYFIMPYVGQLGAAYGIGSTTPSTSSGQVTSATGSTTDSTLTKLLNQYEAMQKGK